MVGIRRRYHYPPSVKCLKNIRSRRTANNVVTTEVTALRRKVTSGPVVRDNTQHRRRHLVTKSAEQPTTPNSGGSRRYVKSIGRPVHQASRGEGFNGWSQASNSTAFTGIGSVSGGIANRRSPKESR